MVSRFINYGLDVFHCRRCHKVVRTYDSRNAIEQATLLDAHVAFNCVDDPFPQITAGVQA